MVVIVETGDGGWDTQEEPRDMLVGRVFGGLPNGRLGRHPVKAGRSAVDPETEPSTPCSSFPDLGNMNTWETPPVSQREDAGVNSTADNGQSGGVDGLSHDESPPPSPSPAAPTGLEGLGDPVVQERLMRETILVSLLEPPDIEATRANREAEGSGMIGGEVYVGSSEAAAASMAVGYSCTYIASETATIESSVSHLSIPSPAAAGAAAGAGGVATGDGLGDAASPPGVGGGGGDASGGVGAYGYGVGGGGQAADSLTMFDAAIQPSPSRGTGGFGGIVSDSFHGLFDKQDSIFRSWPSPPRAPSSSAHPPPPPPSRSPPSPRSPPSEPLPRSAPSPDSHTWQQQQQWPGHGTAGLPSAFSPDRIGSGWSTSRGQETASPAPPPPPSEQVNLVDSEAWLFVVGPVLHEGALMGVAAAGGGGGGGGAAAAAAAALAAAPAVAAAAAVLDASAPVPVAVDNTEGARGGGGGDGGGSGGADDATALSLANTFATWFRSARSPSPATGGICRAVRAVSATLSSLVCPCFERMHDDDDDDVDDSQSERE